MEKKARLEPLITDQILSKTHVDTPVHVGGLKPLSTGELHHHFGLLYGIRFIWKEIVEAWIQEFIFITATSA